MNNRNTALCVRSWSGFPFPDSVSKLYMLVSTPKAVYDTRLKQSSLVCATRKTSRLKPGKGKEGRERVTNYISAVNNCCEHEKERERVMTAF